MATASTSPLPLAGDNFVDAATHGYYWQLDSTRTIKWAIANGFSGETWNNPSGFATNFGYIFNSFSYYANIQFQYAGHFVTPSAAASSADITISLDKANRFFSDSTTWGRAFFPDISASAVYQGAPGDVYANLNSVAANFPSYAPGSTGYFLFLHEIGHALGLKHPQHPGAAGRPTFDAIGLPALDRDWFSVMSYQDDYQLNLLSWEPATPMLLDVLGMQYLYGPNMQTNASNTIHTLSVTNTYLTLWDAGGHDAIDVSGATEGWFIAMPEWKPSTVLATRAGFAAPASEINLPSPHTLYWLTGDMEDAYGSRYADVITGTALNNFLVGNGGNDVMDGGGGLDTAAYSGVRSNYTVLKNSTGFVVTDTTGFSGVDTISGIERLRFSDRSVALDIEGIAGQAYRLYQAAFDRKPDFSGLGFWINALDNGVSLRSVASSFVTSQEFQTLYGANASNAALLTAVYKNVLHRAPDQAGYDWWMGALAGGNLTRSQLLVDFSESAENKLQVIGSIQNGFDYIQWAG